MLDILDQDIGGARVRRTFTRGDHRYRPGDYLDAEDVLSIPVANRRALSDSNFLEIYPKSVSPAPADLERFAVSVGDGKFNVIEGRVLNEEPINKKAAEELVRSRA